MCCVCASFNGFCKPTGSRSRSRGALRSGEKHGKDKQFDDDECLRAQFQGVIRLAKVMSMFLWACFSGAGTGEIWEIDCNENLANHDGGAQWNIWTNMAMQAMQVQGIPVLPCVKILGSIKHLKRDKYHFANDLDVHHAMARIVEASQHIAQIYGSIKEIAHGCVKPWGQHNVVLDPRFNYKTIWAFWPKAEGLGIPGPASWDRFRSNAQGHAVIPHGLLLHCIAAVRFGGKKTMVSCDDIAEEELHRGFHNPVQEYRDYQRRQRELFEICRRVGFMTRQGCVNIGRSAALEDEAMVPEDLKVLYYKTLEVEHRGMTEDGGDTATSAGDPHGASPVEGEVGPQKVLMVPEDAR